MTLEIKYKMPIVHFFQIQIQVEKRQFNLQFYYQNMKIQS